MYQEFPDFNLLLISSWTEYGCVTVVPKYLKSSTLSKELFTQAKIFDFVNFFASEMKYPSLYRFWDAEHDKGHEEAWLATTSKKN